MTLFFSFLALGVKIGTLQSPDLQTWKAGRVGIIMRKTILSSHVLASHLHGTEGEH